MNIRLALAYQRRILGQTCLGSRNMVTASRFLFEKKIVRVPSMGDSITEGTIVEWSKKVGQYVKSDDIIASIETDKVTVEIRAEESGVITQRFVEIDDSVEVGGNLYEIETDGVPVFEAELSPFAEMGHHDFSPQTNQANTETLKPNLDRTPSIKFLGKGGWAALKFREKIAVTKISDVPETSTTVYDDAVGHPMYGRLAFTEAEIDALMMGGASIAPEIVAHSSGAKFK